MAKSEPDRQKASNFLSEHLPYELTMMSYCASKVATLSPGIDWNAYYEAFCIHMRNIYDFLTNGGDRTTFNAHEFVRNFKSEKTNRTVQLMVKINEQVAHPSKKRVVDIDRKVNSDDVAYLSKWAEGEMQEFVRRLTSLDSLGATT